MFEETVSLINSSSGKYLTAETFGFKVNAFGVSLKKKQLWSLEPFAEDSELMLLRSHLNRYLAVDSFGNLTCDTETPNARCRFELCVHQPSDPNQLVADSESKEPQTFWSLRNVTRGTFVGSTPCGMLSCKDKQANTAHKWQMQLLPAPGLSMFAFKCSSRRRFARVQQDLQVQISATDTWDENSLFRLAYLGGCSYAIVSAASGLCLRNDGKCVKWSAQESHRPPTECEFLLRWAAGSVAFQDFRGLYLTASASAALLKTKSDFVGKDEQFDLVPMPLFVQLRAQFNGKWLSVKQGVDVAANQLEPNDDHETFELDEQKDKGWRLCGRNTSWWVASPLSVATKGDTNSSTYFQLSWNKQGACALQCENQKSITARRSGQLLLGPDEQKAYFFVKIANRSVMSLRPVGATGFVSARSGENARIDCVKLQGDLIELQYEEVLIEKSNEDHAMVEEENKNSKKIEEEDDNSKEPSLLDKKLKINCYLLKIAFTEKYWAVDERQFLYVNTMEAKNAQKWFIELRGSHLIAIRAFDLELKNPSLYLGMNPQGILQLIECSSDKAPLWDF